MKRRFFHKACSYTLLSLVFVLLSFYFTVAQGIVVSGSVTNVANEPLAGATVRISFIQSV